MNRRDFLRAAAILPVIAVAPVMAARLPVWRPSYDLGEGWYREIIAYDINLDAIMVRYDCASCYPLRNAGDWQFAVDVRLGSGMTYERFIADVRAPSLTTLRREIDFRMPVQVVAPPMPDYVDTAETWFKR